MSLIEKQVDLADSVQPSVRVFADDALLYAIVARDADCDLLQSDLRRLESWQYHWQMEFNPSKCKIVTISHKNHPPQRKYVFCGGELEQVDSFPYLGVTISNKLKWSAHVSLTAAKANKSLHGYNTTQPLELSKERKRNCIYIPSTTEAGICKCGLGPVFKERYQCSEKGST